MKKIICFIILSASLDVFAQSDSSNFDIAKFKKVCDVTPIAPANVAYCRQVTPQYNQYFVSNSRSLAIRAHNLDKNADNIIASGNTQAITAEAQKVDALNAEVMQNQQALEAVQHSTQNIYNVEQINKLGIDISKQAKSLERTTRDLAAAKSSGASSKYIDKLARVQASETSELDRMKIQYKSLGGTNLPSSQNIPSQESQRLAKLESSIDKQTKSLARTTKDLDAARSSGASSKYIDKLARVQASEASELEHMQHAYASLGGTNLPKNIPSQESQSITKLETDMDKQAKSLARTTRDLEAAKSSGASSAVVDKLARVQASEASELKRMQLAYASSGGTNLPSPQNIPAQDSAVDKQEKSLARTTRDLEAAKSSGASQQYIDKLAKVQASETAELERIKSNEASPQTNPQAKASETNNSSMALTGRNLPTAALAFAITDPADFFVDNKQLEATSREIQSLKNEAANKSVQSNFLSLKRGNLSTEKTLNVLSEKYDQALMGIYIREKLTKTLNSNVICESVEGCRGIVRQNEVNTDKIKAEIFNFNNEVTK